MLLAAVLIAGGFTTQATAATKKAPKTTNAAAFKVHGSIGQAYVEDVDSSAKLLLVNRKNRIIGKGKADSLGSKLFRYLKPGKGYTVRQRQGGKVFGSPKFRVLKPGANPKQSFYDNKELHQGLNYVTMRDGVELAMTVRLPAGKTMADGPFPTVIEHSGYQTAAPHDLLNSILSGKSDPLAPSPSTVVGSLLGPQLGFASISVQMRGSGCSGGAFDLFGLPTTYDGYDMVETAAAQSWVKGKVGMVGISFSGISQLFAAGTQPPNLAAVAPMSVTDDLYTATGYPGGIFNSGFALSWITERVDDAKPAPEGGQPWAKELTTNGDPDTTPPNVPDQHCIDNQKLHPQALDALKVIQKNPHRTPRLFRERAPGDWMKHIKVPVFLTGQYQDEQTGGHFPESLKNLEGNKNVWVTMQNGVHTDSLGPKQFTPWIEFINLFVADRIPVVPPLVSGVLYGSLAGPSAPVEQSRYAGMTDVPAARAAFEKDYPRFRLLMDNGAGPWGLGAQGATWEMKSSSWPPKRVKPKRFVLGKRGKLGGKKPRRASKVKYVADPDARPLTNLVSGSVNPPQPNLLWAPIAKRKGVGFTSSAVSNDVVIAGPSSLDLWVKSSRRDTDFQATISEVRPDGNETYVQSGWLRASHRKLDRKRSSAIDPFPTHLKRDARRMPKRKYQKVRIPIYPVTHAFRKGSKIRVTVSAVGGDRSEWEFATLDKGKTKNTISIGGKRPSRLVLPVLAGADAQGTPLPAPTALRAEPNRTYVKASNGG
ncbi:MAG: CocE/NonD family hydrolase [Solirubrobacterales bacterium]|nr:CocE/NonD family hydrolase [Solirubrobacterales bacterium]